MAKDILVVNNRGQLIDRSLNKYFKTSSYYYGATGATGALYSYNGSAINVAINVPINVPTTGQVLVYNTNSGGSVMWKTPGPTGPTGPTGPNYFNSTGVTLTQNNGSWSMITVGTDFYMKKVEFPKFSPSDLIIGSFSNQ